MGSVKRKSLDTAVSEDYEAPTKKQQQDNGFMKTIDEPVACLHDVSYPEGFLPRKALNTGSIKVENPKPAKECPFTLDSFQLEAIKCLDGGESVMGMTPEIWRIMQYKRSEVIREVAWTIFDEVHYMRDRERGVVWEESIVMAPKNSRFVFLSATVPNAKEFADWVAKVHQQPCHIVYTDYRPTPLQHYIFPSGGDGLYLVIDEKGKFREESFQKALNALVPTNEDRKKDDGNRHKGLVVGKAGEDGDI